MLTAARLLIVAAALWAVAGTLCNYPHQLAYFNELSGGPPEGWRHVLGSSFDWGQDILFAKRWVSDRQFKSVGAAFIATRSPLHARSFGALKMVRQLQEADVLLLSQAIHQGEVAGPSPQTSEESREIADQLELIASVADCKRLTPAVRIHSIERDVFRIHSTGSK